MALSGASRRKQIPSSHAAEMLTLRGMGKIFREKIFFLLDVT
jgi:hypothetical protein